MMRVKVILPSGVLLRVDATKVIAEAPNGSFCLLPHHVDFVSTLVPGILALVTEDGAERFLAVDEGVLVKHGMEVLVSTWNALEGPLGELHAALEKQDRERSEREHKARSALGRLEASLVRQILDWKETGHG